MLVTVNKAYEKEPNALVRFEGGAWCTWVEMGVDTYLTPPLRTEVQLISVSNR